MSEEQAGLPIKNNVNFELNNKSFVHINEYNSKSSSPTTKNEDIVTEEKEDPPIRLLTPLEQKLFSIWEKLPKLNENILNRYSNTDEQTQCTCEIRYINVKTEKADNVEDKEDVEEKNEGNDKKNVQIKQNINIAKELSNNEIKDSEQNINDEKQLKTNVPEIVKPKKSIFDFDFDDDDDPLLTIKAESDKFYEEQQLQKDNLQQVDLKTKEEQDQEEEEHLQSQQFPQEIAAIHDQQLLQQQQVQEPSFKCEIVEDENCLAKQKYEIETQQITKFHIKCLHDYFITNVNGNWDDVLTFEGKEQKEKTVDIENDENIDDFVEVVPNYCTIINTGLPKRFSPQIIFTLNYKVKRKLFKRLNNNYRIPFLGVAKQKQQQTISHVNKNKDIPMLKEQQHQEAEETKKIIIKNIDVEQLNGINLTIDDNYMAATYNSPENNNDSEKSVLKEKLEETLIESEEDSYKKSSRKQLKNHKSEIRTRRKSSTSNSNSDYNNCSSHRSDVNNICKIVKNKSSSSSNSSGSDNDKDNTNDSSDDSNTSLRQTQQSINMKLKQHRLLKQQQQQQEQSNKGQEEEGDVHNMKRKRNTQSAEIEKSNEDVKKHVIKRIKIAINGSVATQRQISYANENYENNLNTTSDGDIDDDNNYIKADNDDDDIYDADGDADAEIDDDDLDDVDDEHDYEIVNYNNNYNKQYKHINKKQQDINSMDINNTHELDGNNNNDDDDDDDDHNSDMAYELANNAVRVYSGDDNKNKEKLLKRQQHIVLRIKKTPRKSNSASPLLQQQQTQHQQRTRTKGVCNEINLDDDNDTIKKETISANTLALQANKEKCEQFKNKYNYIRRRLNKRLRIREKYSGNNNNSDPNIKQKEQRLKKKHKSLFFSHELYPKYTNDGFLYSNYYEEREKLFNISSCSSNCSDLSDLSDFDEALDWQLSKDKLIWSLDKLTSITTKTIKTTNENNNYDEEDIEEKNEQKNIEIKIEKFDIKAEEIDTDIDNITDDNSDDNDDESDSDDGSKNSVKIEKDIVKDDDYDCQNNYCLNSFNNIFLNNDKEKTQNNFDTTSNSKATTSALVPNSENMFGKRLQLDHVDQKDNGKQQQYQTFKEWQQVLQLRSYNDELLTVLPYVVLD